MGKGKGTVYNWIHRLEAGKILFELNNVADEEVGKVVKKAGRKLPTPTVIVERRKPHFKK
jgi:ribosomal protein L16/L10AE